MNSINFEEVVIIPGDAVGNKGDEAMLRGALNLFSDREVKILTPRREVWKGWMLDRNLVYQEEYVELEALKNHFFEATHLVIIGAEILDGVCGAKDSLYRLEAAERVLELGGRVDVFSAFFGATASKKVVDKIKEIGGKISYHFREKMSLENFEKQTGLKGQYFPDLAFLCERTLTDKTKDIIEQIQRKKEANSIVIGLNFSEQVCRGFFDEISVAQRKEYVSNTIDLIAETVQNPYFVLISHDIREREEYYSDDSYAKWAAEYIVGKYSSDIFCLTDNYMQETEILSIIPQMDVVVSGRMHLAIAAIRSGVIPIAYVSDNRSDSLRNSEKFNGMFWERIKRNDLLVSTSEDFKAVLQSVLKEKDAVKNDILSINISKEREMLDLVNAYRKEINLPQMDKDVTNIIYRAGNISETIAYIAQTNAYIVKQADEFKEKMEQEEHEFVEELLDKEGNIEQLKQSEHNLQGELEAMRNSRTWRVAFALHKPVLWLFPEESIRRLFLKMFCRLLRHPFRSIKMLSPRKIRHFMTFLKEEGPGFVAKRIDDSMLGVNVVKLVLDIEKPVSYVPFEELENLYFLKEEKPKVSIVIPVYNHFAYTYNCLKSILKNTGSDVSYEIIIANDCSTDDTLRLQEVAKNIQVITNAENLRFLKNCNHAAKSAKGEYILFLNNDTQVQENWLKSLFELIESSEDIGMVGSKLVYPDGKLQEAGGILWKDGTAWNYGNGQDPTNPEFNYVKEADYISGAAIMIRASVWNEIGGFDERFAPAYYEDTDLAFAVRKHGYKVMYQPQSVVIHFEGVSNGIDVSEGQKAYQVANQKKFHTKWKDVLSKEHFVNGQNVFLAKDKSAKKKTLLMVDHYVPMYDKDAGSRCIFYYLSFFVKMGYNVKFIGDNFCKYEPYTTKLQQMGIEVLYGNYYYNNWKDWIKRNGKHFDYIFLSRPHISVKYIDLMREYTDAKIIYFGVDLHFLRDMREYKLNGNQQALKDSKAWKKVEFELMRKADVSYYLSKVELQEIAKTDNTVKARRVPINIYDDIPEISYKAERRQDIIFVGGFGHPPNIDAVKWLGQEIMPKVWEKNSDITLHVVGSKTPQEIKDFANEHMIIHGFVSDEDLEEMYKNVKMAIVPLRFGAGIKGKVIEAMMRGIPMVTTSIGIEGIEGAEIIAKISDKAEELAAYITSLYNNAADLEKMAEEEHQYIIDNYSVKNAIDILGQDFEF